LRIFDKKGGFIWVIGAGRSLRVHPPSISVPSFPHT
jgi:hypothetical protein